MNKTPFVLTLQTRQTAACVLGHGCICRKSIIVRCYCHNFPASFYLLRKLALQIFSTFKIGSYS
jgi:hypothetical protein